MTAQRIPLPDWRDTIRGIPLAAITENGIKRISKGKDREAQSAIERLSDRKQVKRGEEA